MRNMAHMVLMPKQSLLLKFIKCFCDYFVSDDQITNPSTVKLAKLSRTEMYPCLLAANVTVSTDGMMPDEQKQRLMIFYSL